jgi:hypothetical protein
VPAPLNSALAGTPTDLPTGDVRQEWQRRGGGQSRSGRRVRSALAIDYTGDTVHVVIMLHG